MKQIFRTYFWNKSLEIFPFFLYKSLFSGDVSILLIKGCFKRSLYIYLNSSSAVIVFYITIIYHLSSLALASSTTIISKVEFLQTMSFSSLPDEIIENILARISIWTYPNLSLVSKRFLRLLFSTEIYTTRSHIGTTEPCLYICLDSLDYSYARWFILYMKPNEIITGNCEILNDYSLIPVHSSSPVPYKSTVAVGSKIYVIGGRSQPSSSVRIFDCWSHTWHDAPNMTVAREGPIAVLIDQKIYVMGGCRIDKSANWFEVFDIKTQNWRALLSPSADHDLRKYYMVYRAFPSPGAEQWMIPEIDVNPDALEGKLYIAAREKEYTYEPKDGTWKVVKEGSSLRRAQTWCVIENVMYSHTYSRYLKWYDSEARDWRKIKGLEELHDHPTRGLRKGQVLKLVNYGKKLVVIWKFSSEQDKQKPKIWYAKIALERRHRDEIWGKIEGLNVVLTDPKLNHCSIICVAVSV